MVKACKLLILWWARRDSNPGPPACEAHGVQCFQCLSVRWNAGLCAVCGVLSGCSEWVVSWIYFGLRYGVTPWLRTKGSGVRISPGAPVFNDLAASPAARALGFPSQNVIEPRQNRAKVVRP